MSRCGLTLRQSHDCGHKAATYLVQEVAPRADGSGMPDRSPRRAPEPMKISKNPRCEDTYDFDINFNRGPNIYSTGPRPEPSGLKLKIGAMCHIVIQSQEPAKPTLYQFLNLRHSNLCPTFYVTIKLNVFARSPVSVIQLLTKGRKSKKELHRKVPEVPMSASSFLQVGTAKATGLVANFRRSDAQGEDLAESPDGKILQGAQGAAGRLS